MTVVVLFVTAGAMESLTEIVSVVHGRPVKNTDALANPEALALYQDLAELKT
jgi:hypothetical protein